MVEHLCQQLERVGIRVVESRRRNHVGFDNSKSEMI